MVLRWAEPLHSHVSWYEQTHAAHEARRLRDAYATPC
jgi:hypothetical protein